MITMETTTHRPSLHSVLALALEDQALLRQLAAAPLEVLAASGVHVDAELLKQVLGIHGATDVELLHMIIARVAPFQPSDCSCSS